MSSTAEPIAEVCKPSLPESDLELVDKFLTTRDPAIIAALYRRHGDLVIGVCHRVLTNREDIEDVLQATFLVLIRDLHRMKKRSSVACWLYGVAYRLSLRVVRNRRTLSDRETLVDKVADQNAFEALSKVHDLKTLEEELNRLPDRLRQVLVLRYLMDLGTTDVARELGVTVGAVDGLLKRSKQRLRERLLRRGVSAGVGLAAIQTLQRSAATAFEKEKLDLILNNLTSTAQGPTLPVTSLTSRKVAELATKEIATMATTTKSFIAAGVIVGGMAIGLGTTSWMVAPGGGSLKAAGISTKLAIDHVVRNDVETAPLMAEPVATIAVEETADTKKENPKADLVENVDTRIAQQAGGSQQQQTKYSSTLRKWGYRPKTQRDDEIVKSLDEILNVDFNDVPLKDALNFIEASSQMEILIDDKALAEESISTDVNVNLTVNGLSKRKMFNHLLEKFALDYVIKDEVLMITTMSEADRLEEIRIYDTSPIPGLNSSDLSQMINQLFPEVSKDQKAAGKFFPQGRDRLIVRHNRRFHEKIVDLLEQLEPREEK